MTKQEQKEKPTAVFFRGARKRLKMTQQALSEKLLIERYNLAKYENGTVNPPGHVVLKIIDLMRGNIEL